MLFASLFQDFIVQPIFNLLVFIYAILPGHNFGLAIIIFTIVVRLLMWPLIRKQLHQAKLMRKLQPELKRIKEACKGDKQKEAAMQMELYKERGINPFGSFGTIIVQFIILIGLYIGLKHVVDDPKAIIDNSYSWLRELPWMKTLAQDISKFDATLFGIVDLKRAAIKDGVYYWPALLLVIGSAAVQYFQSKQLLPKTKEKKSLRMILKEASAGTMADRDEVNAATGRMFSLFIPAMVLIFTVGLPAGLSLYWLTGGITAIIQQARVLRDDEEEMDSLADKPSKADIIEGEVVATGTAAATKTKKAKSAKKQRRKR